MDFAAWMLVVIAACTVLALILLYRKPLPQGAITIRTGPKTVDVGTYKTHTVKKGNRDQWSQ